MLISPSIFSAEVISKTQENPKDVRLILNDPTSSFHFTPGQYITLKVSEHIYRSYSICSNADDLPNFSLLIESAHKGVGADYINSLKVTDHVTFIGPSGKLVLPEKFPSDLYFFATGTGIAPFMSMFYQLQKLNFPGNVTLFLGIRKENEIVFEKELDSFSQNLKNFKHFLHVSRPDDTNITPSRVTSVVNNMIDTNALYFLCGHPLMIEEIETGLIRNGISTQNIFKEGFTRSNK